MNKRRKLMVIILAGILALGVGITYSLFTSKADIITTDRGIAKFVFNAETLDNLNLPLIDLKPGDKNDFLFSISNNENEEVSEVTIEYQIVIKTFHIAPLVIKLYKIENEEENFLLECDESYSRNDHNELVCNVDPQFMTYTSAKNDEYRLEIEFPAKYNDLSYSELVDYINLEVKSQQKT